MLLKDLRARERPKRTVSVACGQGKLKATGIGKELQWPSHPPPDPCKGQSVTVHRERAVGCNIGSSDAQKKKGA